MAKQRIFDLQQTDGRFQLKGVVTGTSKDNFYKAIKTKSGRDMRIVNFGLVYDKDAGKDKTLYLNVQGMEQDEVFFYKRATEKGQKGETKRVPWSERFKFSQEGYRMIGTNVGITKKINEKGDEVNDNRMLHDFDVCKAIQDNLSDGESIFVRGNIEYSSFTNSQGNKQLGVKLVPTQISLCKEIDFNEEFEPQNDFEQTIMFMGINKETDDSGKQTGRFVVSAKIVTYGTIEDAEFIIEDAKLANMFRTKLKPYNAIRVSGRIVTQIITEEVKDDDEWGETSRMEQAKSPVKREFIIKGAKGSTVDTTLYSEQLVQEALAKIANAQKAKDDYADTSDDEWGSGVDLGSDEDVDDAWA